MATNFGIFTCDKYSILPKVVMNEIEIKESRSRTYNVLSFERFEE